MSNNITYNIILTNSITFIYYPWHNNFLIGNSGDWAEGSAGFKYSYTIELPPRVTNNGLDDFDLPADRIVPVGKETFAGVTAMLTKLLNDATCKK